jgi:hypothetical protein
MREEEEEEDEDDDSDGGASSGDGEGGGAAARRGPAGGPAARKPIYNVDGLHEKLEDIAWDEEHGWEEAQVVAGEAPTEVDNIDDDLGRELAFYNQVRVWGLQGGLGGGRRSFWCLLCVATVSGSAAPAPRPPLDTQHDTDPRRRALCAARPARRSARPSRPSGASRHPACRGTARLTIMPRWSSRTSTWPRSRTG